MCIQAIALVEPSFIDQMESKDISPHEQLTASLPLSRLKIFEIDKQGFDGPIYEPFGMDYFSPSVLKRLSKLQTFKYLGPLSAKTLAAMIQVGSLRALQVRNSNEILQARTMHNPTATVPWLDFALNWNPLANLRSPQMLEVGCLNLRTQS